MRLLALSRRVHGPELARRKSATAGPLLTAADLPAPASVDYASRELPQPVSVACPAHPGRGCMSMVVWRRGANGVPYSYTEPCGSVEREGVLARLQAMVTCLTPGERRVAGDMVRAPVEQRACRCGAVCTCHPQHADNAGAIAAAGLVPGTHRHLWLVGEPGSGKTMLALHVGRRLVQDSGASVRMVPEALLLRAWRTDAASAGKDLAARAVLDALDPSRISRPTWWIWDDAGMEADPTQGAVDFVQATALAWINAGGGVIATTNADEATLTNLRGDRVVSRLRQHSSGPVRMRGDWRRA